MDKQIQTLDGDFETEFLSGRLTVRCAAKEEKLALIRSLDSRGIKLGVNYRSSLVSGKVDMTFPFVYFSRGGEIATASTYPNTEYWIYYSDLFGGNTLSEFEEPYQPDSEEFSDLLASIGIL